MAGNLNCEAPQRGLAVKGLLGTLSVCAASPMPYYVGVDVGTSSSRAGLFSSQGELVKHSTRDIRTWTSADTGHCEQSSEDIWSAVCSAVREVCSDLPSSSEVGGLGFTATCSLVAVDTKGAPVTVSLSKDPQRNVILWQDHRAVQEAEEINRRGHEVLQFVGGQISPEMQPPKLLWLKRNLQTDCWDKAGHFFDLSDYLTYRATGATSRSLCCVVCKWTYIGHTQEEGSGMSQGWNESFWNGIGLDDLVADGYSRIGTTVLPPGTPVGYGLQKGVAHELGLAPGTPVGTAIIDAHAGGLGMVGADLSRVQGLSKVPVTSRLALIAGTSSCHMASSEHPIFVPGVWGPYFSAMLPGLFLNEGGQSSTGQLVVARHATNRCHEWIQLEHVLRSSSEYGRLQDLATKSGSTIYEELERTLTHLASTKSLEHPSLLTSDFHVLPDYCGNRSPLADPSFKGMVTGLTLGDRLEAVAVQYLATVQALAYGTRLIVEAMERSGHKIEVIMVCGGLRRNRLYVSSHADITGLPVVLTEEDESVLAGAAILAAAAATGDQVGDVVDKMTRVSLRQEDVFHPADDTALRRFHERKYSIFKELYQDQQKYQRLMQLSKQ